MNVSGENFIGGIEFVVMQFNNLLLRYSSKQFTNEIGVFQWIFSERDYLTLIVTHSQSKAQSFKGIEIR